VVKRKVLRRIGCMVLSVYKESGGWEQMQS
jgi:hypothetical protein